jgi:hypothetical protein
MRTAIQVRRPQLDQSFLDTATITGTTKAPIAKLLPAHIRPAIAHRLMAQLTMNAFNPYRIESQVSVATMASHPIRPRMQYP